MSDRFPLEWDRNPARRLVRVQLEQRAPGVGDGGAST
jgi:hypothetical protein